MTQTLIVTEIYASIQGESCYAGLPCVFVRLTGCPLRCRWCDTAHAFYDGIAMSLEDIKIKVCQYGIKLVEITGGEPLAQRDTMVLIKGLIESGYKVLLETSGSEPITDLDSQTHIIMDIKCPGSHMVEHNRYENINYLKPTDEVKFVLADESDYLWAKKIIAQYDLFNKCHILFSVAFGLLQPKILAEWLVRDQLPARLNLQQHKYIWSPRQKGV